MPAAAQFVGNLAGLQMEPRLQRVEDTGFPNSGIPREGRHLSGNPSGQFCDSHPGFSAHPQRWKARLLIGFVERLRRVQIVFVDTDDALAVPPLRE